MRAAEPGTTSVLFVCLGNICRSPTAEGVLRHLAAREAPELRLHIDSAGTSGFHRGDPPDARSIAAARGIDITDLRARQITASDLTRFDYVLAMDESNLAGVRAMRPCGAGTRVQLLLDFFPAAGAREVPDPYERDADAFEHVLDLCEGAARGLIAHLRLHRAPR
jgi:protein-tyrosine phosphatase